MLQAYRSHVADRAALGIPPLPLTAEQTAELCELLKQPPAGEEAFLLSLLRDRIPPGVDQAAYVKAGFLTAIANGTATSPLISPRDAVELLGTMMGGYNVKSLIDLLHSPDTTLATTAAAALGKTLLVYDAFHDVQDLATQGNLYAKQVMQSWADAEWFIHRPPLPESITVTVFKVPGETNTDDLSPAPHATTRPDIPLHATVMLESRMPGALQTIANLKRQGHPVAYVGDVVGTGSSRKSATNSVLWHMGNDIPFVPNKRSGGYVLGGKIAPIFFTTMEDSGALPIECAVDNLNTGDVITIHPYRGEITNAAGEVLSTFALKPDTILDEVRAGGRIPLLIGRTLTDKARASLGLDPSPVFIRPAPLSKGSEAESVGFTLAQKIVGKACGLPGVRPGTYCEPVITTVGSQDTTGPMTRDELKELACLGFGADLVMQSFCHTAAYPKPVDIKTHHELPDFITSRGGVSLRPGDGIIHSWLNRMLLPDTVGTGGDSHTRFPLGISFPAGSGLVAFAAALGVMPLDMPESVLVRFTGSLQLGVTLRDVVNAIPYVAIQQGKLTVAKQNKQNLFSGRIMEMEGLPDLKLEQAFELTDATAERSCAGCTIALHTDTVAEYLRSNVALLKNMVARGYGDPRTILRRVRKMEAWLANPSLMVADANAEYADTIEVDLDQIKEPLVAAPNDPDNIKLMSECAGDPVHEVFIGSCMTNIGHYRAAANVLEGEGQTKVRLWICPPTRMDEQMLRNEGYYSIFAAAGARLEMPGCSLCMGNQARVEDGVTVFSTSTRNFNNRMGKDAKVYLGSAELAAVCALLGRIPTLEEYLDIAARKINPFADNLYRYLNFDQIADFADEGRVLSKDEEAKLLASVG
jgi:aconitate hydratase 2/2-methylisocitrate dehydratase